MKVDYASLEDLLESVCKQARASVRQSRDAIVQQSWQRLSDNAYDRPARHVVAASSLARRRPARALEILAADSEDFRLHPLSNRLAGYACLVRDDLRLASDFFDQSVRQDPHQPDCWNWLGRIAEQDDDLQQAAEYFERGILFDDEGHDSALALSNLHVKNRQLVDAIHVLRVCLIRDQRSPKLNLALAKLLGRRAFLLGRRRKFRAQQRVRREAIGCYRTVNATSPCTESLVLQGRLEQQLLDHTGAIATFQKAVQLDPNSAAALSHLAGANVDFGKIDTALSQFERSLTIDSSRADTHFRYTRAKRFKPNRESTVYVQTLKHQLALSVGKNQRQKQIHLNFALAKVHDDCGDFDKAWHHYDTANRLKAKRPSTSQRRPPSKTTAHTPLRESADHTINGFTPEFFHAISGSGNPTRTPIFIVGMPRSGTTLTEQILSSHPEVAGAGELNDINLIRQEISRNALDRPGHRPRGFPDQLTATAPAELKRYADHYVAQLNRFRSNESHVTDKMPTNFMHLGLIATLFPGATVVHCRRNPMDVIVSCYCQNLNGPFCDLEQLVDYHRQYRRLMAHWEQVLPIKIYSNDYESLVAKPEIHAKALIQHCNLQWSDDCMRFHSNHRAVHTPSKWQVRQPMYRSSVEKWRRFQQHLTPIAQRIRAEMQDERLAT